MLWDSVGEGISGADRGAGPAAVPVVDRELPYAPYGRGDRLGRSADWSSNGYNKFSGRSSYGGVTVFNFEAEEEDTFHLVDTKPVVKRFGRRFQQRAPSRREREAAEKEKLQQTRAPGYKEKLQPKKKAQDKFRWAYWRRDIPVVNYGHSVEPRPNWESLETIEMERLAALHYECTEQAETLVAAGSLEPYDKTFDRAGPRAEMPVPRTTGRQIRLPTPSRDGVMLKLAASGAGDVFCSDTLMATLMASPRSIFPWDFLVTKRNGQIWLDKRDNAVEMQTNSETSQEPVPNDPANINGCQKLAEESTRLNMVYSQMVLNQQRAHKLKEGHPFRPEGDKTVLAGTGFFYRRWQIGSHRVVVRCAVDASQGPAGANPCLLRALNEFDSRKSGVDFRQKLDNQRSAVLANEQKNNANKVSKWCMQATLGGVESIRLGYISRVHAKDNTKHKLLGSQLVRTADLCNQIGLEEANCFGIAHAILDIFKGYSDGRYIIVREPNKTSLRIYSI